MTEHSLRYIDNGSLFNRIDAISKAFWVLIIILFTFQLQTNISRLLVLISLLFTVLLLARVPASVLIKTSPIILIMGSLLFVVNLFFTPSTHFIKIVGISFGLEGLDKGLFLFLRITIMVLASFTLIWTTDIRDLMVGLVRLGMPYRYAFSIFLALRFLPIIQQEVDAVKAAHAIRGRASSSPIRHRFRLWQRYLFTVIVNGLRKAESTALAIESRGFGAYSDRTYVKDFRWTLSGILLMLLFIILGISLIFWEQQYL